ncbi:hypothetical protein [Pseudoalteromonas sp. 68 DY56-GL68]|uniref:hypothetical protein n=1 Tax=Pseudoalteromonas sp. 68 DY56-GL68 TaxID=2974919 RepID=UPI00352BBD4D
MPKIIDCNTEEKLEFSEFLEILNESKINTACEDEMLEFAPYLKMLNNNKQFLSNIIINELKDYENFQNNNSYTSQVIMLAPPKKGSSFFVRANIWPAKDDYLTQINGEDTFFYHKPHDHNFNFLTSGYHGSGYWSDYYEYDYEKVIGYPGEEVDLKFIERSKLSIGKLMLYRAHIDVHDQLPADEFSISINVMENTLRPLVTDQYAFDTERKKIKKLLNRHNALFVMRASLVLNDQNSLDIIDHISKKHSMDAVRMAAIDAIALSNTCLRSRAEVYQNSLKANSSFISKNSYVRLRNIEEGL